MFGDYGRGSGCGGNFTGMRMNSGTSIGMPIFQSGSIPSSSSGNSIGSTNCFYKLNNETSWTNLSMTGTSSFTATIPAQPNGTVVAYYISLTDNFGNESAVTPVAANLTPINNANLPYFILVGFEVTDEEDFDANQSFWQTGGPGDNATTGMWEIGIPIASYGDPQDFSTICQTGTQNTCRASRAQLTR